MTQNDNWLAEESKIRCDPIKQAVGQWIRYNTVYLRALKSWRDVQPNLAHDTETKENKEKLKIKTEWLRRNGPGDSPWDREGSMEGMR